LRQSKILSGDFWISS